MNILIWGTGKMSARLVKGEYFKQDNIVGFVNSFKNDYFMGYSVYRPAQISKIEFDYLIVCVEKSNSEILETCINEGVQLEKVLFVNEVAGFENIEEKYINRLAHDFDIKNVFPALYKFMQERCMQHQYNQELCIKKELCDQSAVIKKIGDSHVVVWIPIELLFSERREDIFWEEYTDEWVRHINKWQNLPMVSFTPHHSLFHFFMMGNEYPMQYCKWYHKLFTSLGKHSGFTDETLIEKRFREFRIMQAELNKGMRFFIEAPATATWNQRGYFNLSDGHHRASFLYHSGCRMIPVQITKNDYIKWCNKNSAELVKARIIESGRNDIYQPILNPYFMGIPSLRDNYVRARLHHILAHFKNKRFVNKSLIDIGANLGFFGQMFCRMGASVTMIEPDLFHFELLNDCNHLLYAECKTVMQPFEEFETEDCYDIALLLTVLYPYLSKADIKKEFFDKINRYVKEYIIWESGENPKEELKEIIKNTKFQNYQHLCYTFATGKFRELGIFMTDNVEDLIKEQEV